MNELIDIGDTSFTEDSHISNLTTNLSEGFDVFLMPWDSTPLEDRTFANLQLRLYMEEARLKKRIVAYVTSDTKAYYSNKSFSGATSRHHNHFAPHMRISRSGNPGRTGNYRNVGRGYQPTASHYTSRSSHPMSHTSYGDQKIPYIPSARLTTTSHHAMELKALKSRIRCNYCGRLGHWWQECMDRDHGRLIKASLADALPMHHSYFPNDFSLFLSYMSTLDVGRFL